MYKINGLNFKILAISGFIFCSVALNAQQSQAPGQAPYYQMPAQSEKSLSNVQFNVSNSQLLKSQTEAQKMMEVEKHRLLAEQEARKSIVQDAVSVIRDTRNAVMMIRNGRDGEAKKAIELASTKIDQLLARYPNKALLPIDFYVDIIDTAPLNVEKIKEIASGAEKAVRNKDYPEARYFLEALQSEINVETYSLPLGIYPLALKKAASSLQQRANQEAIEVLVGALNSIVVIDQTLPIPLIGARALLALAEQNLEGNKELSLKILEAARFELERAKDLGYVSKDDGDYYALNDAIKDLQKEINSNKKNPSLFATLKYRFEAFLKKHFEKKKSTEELSGTQK